MVKNLPANAGDVKETWVWSQGWKDPLEEGMASYSSILAWRIPWIEAPGGLQSIRSQRVGHVWSNLAGTACLTMELISITRNWDYFLHKNFHLSPKKLDYLATRLLPACNLLAGQQFPPLVGCVHFTLPQASTQFTHLWSLPHTSLEFWIAWYRLPIFSSLVPHFRGHWDSQNLYKSLWQVLWWQVGL